MPLPQPRRLRQRYRPRAVPIVEDPASDLWADFIEARAVAEKSCRIEDGIRAGKAWGAFLSAFIDDAPPLAPEAPR